MARLGMRHEYRRRRAGDRPRNAPNPTTSKNETFITLDDPECDTLYRTVAYLAGVEEGAQEEGEALTNTWSAFAPVSGQDDVCAWNEETDDYDRPLYYWQDQNPVSTVSGLLQGANGNCDAWTRLFRESLRVNGADVERIVVRPPAFQGGPSDPRLYRLVIKNVDFKDPSYPGTEWPYLYEDIDQSPQGIAGQNMETPAQKAFPWHFIGRYLVEDPLTTTYYDPSYGRTYDAEDHFTSEAIAAWGMQVEGELRFRKPVSEIVRFQREEWPQQ
ncbi:MAG: hypothetical protein R6X33_08465 [Candidatus Brocadiia bacterium]